MTLFCHVWDLLLFRYRQHREFTDGMRRAGLPPSPFLQPADDADQESRLIGV
jgi:hypothetical protein